ncbi:MAG: hypothetical protein IKR51_07980, partial [Oscillospiraceae bacterium]|nr:hypothetical protein [Oscillospiraceae bacterium]
MRGTQEGFLSRSIPRAVRVPTKKRHVETCRFLLRQVHKTTIFLKSLRCNALEDRRLLLMPRRDVNCDEGILFS